MISRSIMEKMGTFPDEIIHIMPGYIVHLHDHQSKMVPFMKPSIFANFCNGSKFHICICWSTNDIQSHHLLLQVSNHHINNEDLVLSGNVKIGS